MEGSLVYYLLLAIVSSSMSTPTHAGLDLEKRVLPIDENCDPWRGTCVKGDWLAQSIADCYFDSSIFHPISCTAKDDSVIHWVVEPEENGNCLPVSGTRIHCGDSGTKTRCVCSSTKVPFNQCRCQYWTEETAGESKNAFCTAYYINAGASGVHHYACCNNCNDPISSCDGQTWQGGSSGSYCSTCGTPTGGGVDKYYFNCENCQTQSACANKCEQFSSPGSCWKWVDCFAGCCRQEAAQFAKREGADTTGFCGDGTCEQSSENPDTCPSDCCYMRNSECGISGCTPECCQTTTCCLKTATLGGIESSASAPFGGGILLLVLVGFLSFIH